MGKFFNERVKDLHKIPTEKGVMEGMRKDYNASLQEMPSLTVADKRRANLEKAREAKRKKREANG